MSENKYLMVSTSVLPSVFEGVLEAKEFLASKEASSVAQAVRMAGISRSAFYKYKDYVFPVSRGADGRMVNISAVLKDRAGVLSSFISRLYGKGMNIVTVNQGVPVNGAAQVSVSVKTNDPAADIDSLMADLAATEGVASVSLVMTE